MQQELIKDFQHFIKVLSITTHYIVKSPHSKANISSDFFCGLLRIEAEKLFNHSEISEFAQKIINSLGSNDVSKELITNIAVISGKVTTILSSSLESNKEDFFMTKDANNLIAFISEHSHEIADGFTCRTDVSIEYSTSDLLAPEKSEGILAQINFVYTTIGFKVFEAAESIMMARFSYIGIIPFGIIGALVHGGKALFKVCEAFQAAEDITFFSNKKTDHYKLPYHDQGIEEPICPADQYEYQLYTETCYKEL